ncbi:hypothetical protein [Arthrobacter sp.]|uniref:hypothetical protein n=1 Tax=Arthrobacter sp. TaxID=1667 RepID=UPI003A90D2DD
MNEWATTGQAPAIALMIAVGAVLLYGFLRLQARTPVSGDPRRSARTHALWTAIIAFFASSTSALTALVRVPAPTQGTDGHGTYWTSIDPAGHTTLGLAWIAASPGLWLGLVYILAQFTWPRPHTRVRTATLEARTLRDHLPPVLTGIFASFSLLGLGAVAWAWASPAVPPIPGREVTQDGADGGTVVSTSVRAIDGLRPGTESGPWLLSALLLAVAATGIAALVIVKRRPLSGLSGNGNHTLRLIGLNRLLRTAILVVGGIMVTAAGSAMAAAQYAALDTEAWSNRGGLMVGAAASGADKPWGWLVTVLAIGQYAVLVAMAAAAPPRLRAADEPVGTLGTAHLPGSFTAGLQLLTRTHVFAVALATIPLAGALLALPGFVDPVMRFPAPALSGIEGPLVFASLPFAFYFLCMSGVEALLRRGHCPPRGARPATSKFPPTRLPAWAWRVGVIAYTVALVLSVLTPHGDRSLVVSLSVGLVVSSLPAAGWWLMVRNRPPLGRASTHEDLRLRGLSRHRILRLGAANLFMATGMIVLMDSASWFHGAAMLGNDGGPLTWQAIRWTGSSLLFTVAALTMFLPSAEFSRTAQDSSGPEPGTGRTEGNLPQPGNGLKR